ncbi:MAG: S41 family peptidase [Chitinophagaceae bacterium]
MCKLPILVVFLILFSASATAQADTNSISIGDRQVVLNSENTQSLYYLGKIWGFIKYFHPAMTQEKKDWDTELISFLPRYLNTRSQDRNDSLLSWIDRVGDIPAVPAPDYKSLEAPKLMPDFSWISEKQFGLRLTKKLQVVLAHRQQGDQRYIKFFRTEGLNIPVFQNEKRFPAAEWSKPEVRLLALFRFWNAMEYWYPYKYNLPISWDKVLNDGISEFLQADSPEAYNRAIMRLVTALHDGHGFVTSAVANNMMGSYYLPVRFKYVQGQVIISSISKDSAATVARLAVGDIVESIDGRPIKMILEEKLPLTPGSTRAYQYYSVCLNLNRSTSATTVLGIRKKKKKMVVTVQNELNKGRIDQYVPAFRLQRDSSMSMLDKGIVYLNMGKLTMKEDSARMVQLLERSSGLIIDARQNAVEDPKRPNVIGLLEEWICEGNQPYVFSTGQPEFAGAFLLAKDSAPPFKPHPVRYNKPVVILINEEAISVGEFMSMLFSKAPGAILMGSATAGADGPSSYFQLPGDVYAGFTGTGIYWKDGSETQRVGIRPDIEVLPTIKGFRQNRDELVEKAARYLTKKMK